MSTQTRNTIVPQPRGKALHGTAEFALVARIQQQPPPDWGLAVGDVLVDLRSALDYAVYELAVNATGGRPDNPRTLEFPIAKDRDWFDKRSAYKINQLKPAARELFVSPQPYAAENHPVEHDPLFQLNELVGIYKHRFVSLSWFALDSAVVYGSIEGGAFQEIATHGFDGKLEDGAEVATIRVAVAEHAELQFKPEVTVEVAIESPASVGGPAIGLRRNIDQMGGRVDEVLTQLERHSLLSET